MADSDAARRPTADVTPLYSAADIAARVAVLAKEIADRAGQDLMIIAVLKGSFVFTADLLRALHHENVRPQLDFMTLASYGANTTSSGNVEVVKDISDDVTGRNVLLVDDILESGQTLTFARQLLFARGAASVRICVLLEKPGKRRADAIADFVGFQTPDVFVVGYGLDFAHFYRELPYIGVIASG